MELRILSLNCHGFKSSIDEIKTLCDSHDIILLQETMLMPHDLHKVKKVHKDFYGDAISAVNDEEGIHIGRPPGGLAILWRKSLNLDVAIKKYDDPRLMGMNIKTELEQIFVLNVYMPVDHRDNLDDFQYYMYLIHTLFRESNTTKNYAVGDFNANIRKPSCFGEEITDFCKDKSYVLSDKLLLPSDTFTYYSVQHDTVSWLDHIMTSVDGHCIMSNINVMYDVMTSDHFPLLFSITIDGDLMHATDTESVGDECGNDSNGLYRIDWSKVKLETQIRYYEITDALLSNVKVPSSVLNCNDINCIDVKHRQDIAQFYDDICNCLKCASDQAIPGKARSNFTPMPGWNEHLRGIYKESQDAFHMWRINGKPRQGQIFESMKVARSRFKYARRAVARNEESLRADALAHSLDNGDCKSFWKEVKRISTGSVPLPNKVDDACGSVAITDMWKNHYCNLFNSVKNDSYKGEIEMYISRVSDDQLSYFNCIEVRDAISDLPKNKSPGHDGLMSEHLQKASGRLAVLLSLNFSFILRHGYLPDRLMMTLLSPILKSKNGAITDKSNYRPIALATVCTKVLEICLLTRFDSFICTTDNQFAYKKGHATDLCVYLLKESISYYVKHSSLVYVCLLDASKAFDKLNHWILFKRLKDRGCPGYLVRVLVYWYQKQQICVKWGTRISEPFGVNNGIKQGGILSPKLFNVYVDYLSQKLNDVNAGCCIGKVKINHLYYADDLCLICPSIHGLSLLIDTCVEFAKKNDIVFNEKKTECLFFKPVKRQVSPVENIEMNGKSIELSCDAKYLGHILSCNRSDNLDIGRQLKSLYSRCNMLIRTFSACNSEVKCNLFVSYCSSLYTSQLWCNYTKKQIGRLKVAYNNVLRRLLGYSYRDSASAMFVQNRVDGFDARLRKIIYGFRKRVHESENKYISAFVKSHVWAESDLNKHWDNVLYL